MEVMRALVVLQAEKLQVLLVEVESPEVGRGGLNDVNHCYQVLNLHEEHVELLYTNHRRLWG